MNVFKRAQVLDYWQRGRSARTIAYILQVPLSEVQALIDRWEKNQRGPEEA